MKYNNIGIDNLILGAFKWKGSVKPGEAKSGFTGPF